VAILAPPRPIAAAAVAAAHQIAGGIQQRTGARQIAVAARQITSGQIAARIAHAALRMQPRGALCPMRAVQLAAAPGALADQAQTGEDAEAAHRAVAQHRAAATPGEPRVGAAEALAG
jgi:hypothetical protein